MDFLTNIFQGLLNFPWEGFYHDARIVFTVLDAVLFVGFIYALKKTLEYRPDIVGSFIRREERAVAEEESKFNVERYAEHWKGIKEKALTNPPESLTLAIVAADNLVGDALDEMGLEGEHIADKLEKLNARELKTLNSLWRAHRIRNDLVHTTGFEIKESEAKEVLNIYESFLKELGALK